MQGRINSHELGKLTTNSIPVTILSGLVWASCVAPLSAKHLPAMRETCVQFLGREVPLEKEMATHSGILAWRIPRTEVPGRLQFMGLQELDTT